MSRPTMRSSRVDRRLRAGVALVAVASLCVACGGTSSTPSSGTGSPASASAAAAASATAPSFAPTSTTPPSGSEPVTQASPAPSPDATPTAYVSATGVVGKWVALGRSSGGGSVDRLVALSDGRILVTGAFPGPETRALVFDPVARTWTPSSVQVDPRDAVVARPDGSVFVAGASDATVWRNLDSGVGSSHPSRHGLAPSAAALDDGRILVAGGCIPRKTASGKGADDVPLGGDAISAAEIRDLDPSTGRDVAAPTGDLSRARVAAPAATLVDGRVLIAGSVTSHRFWFSDAIGDAACAPDPAEDAEWSAEVWDSATGRFIPTGAIPEPDPAAVAALGIDLPDGLPRVDDAGRLVPLLDGGALLLDRRESWSVGVANPPGTWPIVTQLTRSLRYDAATDAWHEIGVSFVRQEASQHGADRSDEAVARLADGRVLVAGGRTSYGYEPIHWADLYDPAAGRWLPVPPLPEPLGPAAAVAMADGSAVVIGATEEDYRIDDPPELVAYWFVPTSPPDAASRQGAAGSVPPAPAAGACPQAVTPSSLAALEPSLRIGCFDGRDLVFDADVVIASGTIIDMVPFQTPTTFRPVRRPTFDGDPETEWPVVLVDTGSTVGTPATWLPLVVADGNVIPWQLDGSSSPLRARITGHVDDGAAPACLRPRTGWPELTDEDAVLLCRSTFVVTRMEPLE
jgi:hypothetical protein